MENGMVKKGEYLILDVGTTSVKVSVLTRNFQMTAHSSREYTLEAWENKVELKPEKYISAAFEGIREVLKQDCIHEIRGIAVTTQGETLIPVDEKGRPLGNAIVWLDRRAEEQGERIRSLIPDDIFYKKTGIPQCNGLCPVSKLLWIKENRKEVYEKTKYFLLLEDYLIYWLTGKFATERSLLSTTGYYDIQNDCLWTELMEKIGLDQDKIPPVCDCGSRVGGLLPEIAEKLGISYGAQVITAAMDQICSALGGGNYSKGTVTETTGTAMCVGATADRYTIQPECKIPVYRHYEKNKYMYLAVCMTAGMALKWFKDVFCKEEQKRAEEMGISVYELLDQMAENAQHSCGDLLMLPYLSGSVQPYEAPGLCGSFHGISLGNTKEDFLRSIMEGVGFMLKENLELLEKVLGKRVQQITSMGGGAKGKCWCQIKAEIADVVIRSCSQSETTSVGAGILCAKGLGDYASVEAAAAVMEESAKACMYFPRQEKVILYQQAYEKYLKYLKQEVKLALEK